jgi:hypothetical protein
MNPNMGLARLGQPRSNTATNMLFAITFVVFAFIADMAIDQQQGEIAGHDGGRDAVSGTVLTMDLRALMPRPHF